MSKKKKQIKRFKIVAEGVKYSCELDYTDLRLKSISTLSFFTIKEELQEVTTYRKTVENIETTKQRKNKEGKQEDYISVESKVVKTPVVRKEKIAVHTKVASTKLYCKLFDFELVQYAKGYIKNLKK